MRASGAIRGPQCAALFFYFFQGTSAVHCAQQHFFPPQQQLLHPACTELYTKIARYCPVRISILTPVDLFLPTATKIILSRTSTLLITPHVPCPQISCVCISENKGHFTELFRVRTYFSGVMEPTERLCQCFFSVHLYFSGVMELSVLKDFVSNEIHEWKVKSSSGFSKASE